MSWACLGGERNCCSAAPSASTYHENSSDSQTESGHNGLNRLPLTLSKALCSYAKPPFNWLSTQTAPRSFQRTLQFGCLAARETPESPELRMRSERHLRRPLQCETVNLMMPLQCFHLHVVWMMMELRSHLLRLNIADCPSPQRCC